MTPLIISFISIIKFIFFYSERSSICREQPGTAGAVTKRAANFKLVSSWQHTAIVWVQCRGCWALSCVPVHAQWLFRGSPVMSGIFISIIHIWEQFMTVSVIKFWMPDWDIIMERHNPLEFMLSIYVPCAFAYIIGHIVHLLHTNILLQSLKQCKVHWEIIFHCI
jgi:hypothetical protein